MQQVQVNLLFSADTSKAKASLQELQQNLSKLATLPGKTSELVNDASIKAASKAALELSQHLSKAVNTNTGKIDLSRLSTSLKAANRDLNTYYSTLLKAGPTGQQAFISLANSVAQAEQPTIRLGQKMQQLGTTLKNTIKWQLSSTLIHGFVGGISSAYNYSKELNASLNDIRIVTGNSAEQMKKFAIEANKAAKNLGSTTKAYTDASLIYFQQGLSESEVKKRTDATIKMANVTGESAKEVSDYMTAVWNNFDNGSKSLEYYADVMTALGAATASSTDEIAAGLEKFAAVAETVGLSYEYATTALATVTAETRQSADTVGTAFKTLFSRIQGLSLGETLDDGTTLNKYSEALNKVGISIKEQDGSLKQMDTILNEMGAKWQTLSRDQQVALAQTVAGIRQYNQLMSLMNNWDTFKINLEIAEESEGTLQKQQDIYKESWQAASDEVRVSLEKIWSSVFEDKAFISLTRGFAKVIETLGGFVDGLGGLKGILLTVSGIFMTYYANKMPDVLNRLSQDWMVLTGAAQKQSLAMQQSTQAVLHEQSALSGNSQLYNAQVQGLLRISEMKELLAKNSHSMTAAQKEEYELRIQNIAKMNEEANAAAKLADQKKRESEKTLTQTIKGNSLEKSNTYRTMESSSQRSKRLEEQEQQIREGIQSGQYSKSQGKLMRQQVNNDRAALDLQRRGVQEQLLGNLSAAGVDTDKYKEAVSRGEDFSILDQDKKAYNQAVSSKMTDFSKQTEQSAYLQTATEGTKGTIQSYVDQASALEKAAAATEKTKASTKQLSKEQESLRQSMQEYVKSLTQLEGSKAIDSKRKEMLNFIDKCEKGEISVEELANELKNMNIDQAIDEELAQIEKEANDSADALQRMGVAEDQITGVGQAAQKSGEQKGQAYIQQQNIGNQNKKPELNNGLSTQLTAVAGTASMMAATFTTLQSTWSTLWDEGATGAQRVGAALSALSVTLGLVNSLQQLSTALGLKDKMMKLGQAAATLIMGKAKAAETAAVWSNTAAWYANPIMWIAIVIVAVVAALAALTVALINSGTSAQKEFEAASEHAKAMEENLQETKQAAQELKETIESYDSAVKKLEECTKGTDEWNKALKEVNNQALDLLQKFPELVTLTNTIGEKAFTRNEDTGQIEIQDWALTDILNKAEQSVRIVEGANFKASQEVRNAQYQLKVDDYKMDYREGYPDRFSVIEYGNFTVDKSDYMFQEITNNLDKLSSMTTEEQQAWLQKYQDNEEVYFQNMDIWVKAIEELSAQKEINTESKKLENQITAEEYLKGANVHKEVATAEFLGEAYQVAYDNAYQALENERWGKEGVSKATGVNPQATTYWQEFLDAAGWNPADHVLADTTGTDEDRAYVYVDSEGEEKTITLKQMMDIKASADALSELGANVEKINGLFIQLSSSADKADKALAQLLINQNLEGATREETETLINKIGNGDKEFSEDEIKEFLKEKFGEEDITDEVAKDYGFKSASDMIASYQKNLNNINKAWEDVIGKMPESLQHITNITLDTARRIPSAINTVFQNAGYEAEGLLEDILGNLREEDIEDFLNVLNNFDWSQDNASEKFIKQLKEQNVLLGASQDIIEDFSIEMEEAGHSFPVAEINKFIDKIYELKSLLKDLKIGSIVEEGTVSKLEEVGYAIEDYAVKTYNGWILVKDLPKDAGEEKGLEQAQTGLDIYKKEASQRHNVQTGDNVVASDINRGETAKFLLERSDTDSNVGAAKFLSKIISGKTDEELEAMFGGQVDSIVAAAELDYEYDSAGKVKNTTARATREEIDAALQAYLDFFNAGEDGTLQQNVDNLEISEMVETGLSSMSNLTENSNFKTENGEISLKGSQALQGIAALMGEEGQLLLSNYQEAIEGVAEGTAEWIKANKELEKGLKRLQINKAAENAGKLFDELKDLTGLNKKLKFDKIALQLESIFGKKITGEYIANHQDLVEQYLKGATEMERGAAAQQIAFDTATTENLSAEESTAAIEMGIDLDTESYNAALEELSSPELKPVVLNCIATGDFSALLADITSAEDDIGGLLTNLSTIGATNLSPAGFDQLLEAISKFQEAIELDEEGNFNVDKLDEAKKVLKQDLMVTFQGDRPNVAPDIRKAGGGGSGDKESTSLKDRQKKALEREQKKLKDARDNLYAEDAQKYYEKEIELLKEERKILEQQLKIKKDMLKTAVSEFEKNNPEFDIVLDDKGEIAGLSQLLGQIEAEATRIAASQGEDVANKYREEMLNNMDEMLKLNDEVGEINDSVDDLKKEEAELALEAITAEIDEKVADIEWEITKLNYYQEKLIKQAHGNKQEIEAMLEGFQYQEQEMLQLFEKGQVLQEGIEKLNQEKKNYSGYEKMFEDQIREYQEDLVNLCNDILDLRNEIEDLVQNVLDKALDEIGTQTGRLDTYNSILSSFNNIIDLSGRSVIDFSQKVKISGIQMDTMMNKMQIIQEKMAGLTEATKIARETYQERIAAGDEQSVKFWENQLSILEQEMEAASSEFLSTWEEVLTTAGELFEMKVEAAVNVLSNALSPFSSLDVFQEAYDRAKSLEEQYLDETTKLYELSKLSRQVNMAIADENDLLGKEKLKAIQQDILALQQTGVEMSQYDLDILQKKYDLQLAEIALMEAQNSKTQMRLTRDAAGNWTYVYDADEKEIQDAAQTYEDALYELSNVSKEYLTDISDQLLKNQKEYTDAITDLDKTSADYEEQLLDLQEYYTERQRYLLSELNKGVVESGLTFHDTLYGQMADIYNYEDAYAHFVDNSNTTISELITNYKEWQQVVQQAMNVAGTSWEDFSQYTDTSLDDLEDHISVLCEQIEELTKVLMDYTKQSVQMVSEWQEKYSLMTEAMLETFETVINTDYSTSKGTSSGPYNGPTSSYTPSGGYYGSSGGGKGNGVVGATVGDWYYDPINGFTYLGNKSTGGSTGTSGSGTNAWDVNGGFCARWASDVRENSGDPILRSSTASGLVQQGQADKYQANQDLLPGSVVVVYDPRSAGHAVVVGNDGYLYGTSTSTKSQMDKTTIDDYDWDDLYVIPPSTATTGQAAGQLAQDVYETKERQARQFDTGGYTGNWNSDEGRWAILHEKELVLNKDDTENMLNALSILRNLNLSIDKQVSSMLNQTSFNLGNLLNQVQIPNYEQLPIEQQVEIIAEFPSVTDRYEIQEALANLTNNASQYLNLNKNI